MYQLAISLEGRGRPLYGNDVTLRGIHGLLYSVLKASDTRAATWLHEHRAPKPYSLAAYYGEEGVLAGLRISALTDDSAEIIHTAWQKARHHDWKLGKHPLCVRDVLAVPRASYAELSELPAVSHITLNFLSPTNFKQGPGQLPLPLPRNVFRTPLVAWNSYAPHPLGIREDWLEWCNDNVFVAEHRIETAHVTLSRQQPPFIGFVGEVTFEIHRANRYKDAARRLHTLAKLTEITGIGRKTTMGMGAVELL